MTFNKKLLDIVACPACKGKLVFHEVPNSEDTSEQPQSPKQELVCRFDKLAYPVDSGIPVLLESESRLLSLEELEQVKKHD